MNKFIITDSIISLRSKNPLWNCSFLGLELNDCVLLIIISSEMSVLCGTNLNITIDLIKKSKFTNG